MFKKQYKFFIKDMQRAHESLVDDLKYHILWLQKKIYELEEENEQLRGPDPLLREIREYNKLEGCECPGCNNTIEELRAENDQLKKEIKKLKKNNK